MEVFKMKIKKHFFLVLGLAIGFIGISFAVEILPRLPQKAPPQIDFFVIGVGVTPIEATTNFSTDLSNQVKDKCASYFWSWLDGPNGPYIDPLTKKYVKEGLAICFRKG
jgi:hypothetical protein